MKVESLRLIDAYTIYIIAQSRLFVIQTLMKSISYNIPSIVYVTGVTAQYNYW